MFLRYLYPGSTQEEGLEQGLEQLGSSPSDLKALCERSSPTCTSTRVQREGGTVRYSTLSP